MSERPFIFIGTDWEILCLLFLFWAAFRAVRCNPRRSRLFSMAAPGSSPVAPAAAASPASASPGCRSHPGRRIRFENN